MIERTVQAVRKSKLRQKRHWNCLFKEENKTATQGYTKNRQFEKRDREGQRLHIGRDEWAKSTTSGRGRQSDDKDRK